LLWQQNEDFLIQIKLDKAEDLSTARIDGEWRLMELLSSYEALIVKVYGSMVHLKILTYLL